MQLRAELVSIRLRIHPQQDLKRNKLSPAKAEELVCVFSNLRLLRRFTDANATELFWEWQSEGAAATAQGETTTPIIQQSSEGLCDTESDLSEEVEMSYKAMKFRMTLIIFNK